MGNRTVDNGNQFSKGFATFQAAVSRAPHPRLIGEFLGRLTHYAVYGYDSEWGTITSDTPGAGESWVAALGARLRWDGRDSGIHPTRGWRLSAGIDLARAALGSEWSFAVYRAESSAYVSPAKKHGVAGRWWMQTVSGNAPYMELSKVGDSWTARGFKADRFLDRAMTLLSAEYRFPLLRRLGGVAFMDIGRVWPSLKRTSLRAWHPDAGAGLRYCPPSSCDSTWARAQRVFLRFGHVF